MAAYGDGAAQVGVRVRAREVGAAARGLGQAGGGADRDEIGLLGLDHGLVVLVERDVLAPLRREGLALLRQQVGP